jgi:predicted GNAT family acetyltransferase
VPAGAIATHFTDDVHGFLAATGDFLRSSPVVHNLVLSIADQRRTDGTPGRWAWAAAAGGEVVGAVAQSPTAFAATATPMPATAARALAVTLAESGADLPGLTGEAAVAATFAGAWATERGVPVRPTWGQRLYRLGSLRPPTGVEGALRPATAADVATLVAWDVAFETETGLTRPAGIDRDEVIARRVAEGAWWVWEAGGEPTSGAFASPPLAGASRIGAVYTPPEHRGRGRAAALVAGISAHLRSHGAPHCLLYTQLENPHSNRIYQRLGYEPVAEVLAYAFEPSPPAP